MEVTIKPVTASAKYVVEVETYDPDEGSVLAVHVLTADELLAFLTATLPYKPQGPLKSNIRGVK